MEWWEYVLAAMLIAFTVLVVYLLGVSVYMINDCMQNAQSRWC